MPDRDGKGPDGREPVGGNRGGGGRQGGRGAGPSGYCVCPSCGEKTTHKVGMPCTSLKCPKCGSPMVRE